MSTRMIPESLRSGGLSQDPPQKRQRVGAPDRPGSISYNYDGPENGERECAHGCSNGDGGILKPVTSGAVDKKKHVTAAETALVAAAVAAAAAKAATAAAKATREPTLLPCKNEGSKRSRGDDVKEGEKEALKRSFFLVKRDIPEGIVITVRDGDGDGNTRDRSLAESTQEEMSEIDNDSCKAHSMKKMLKQLSDENPSVVARKAISLTPADGFVTEDCNLILVLKRHANVDGSYSLIGAVEKARGMKDTVIAYFMANMIDRPRDGFYSSAMEINPELRDIAWTFCDSTGRVVRVDHPEIRREGSSVHQGGFLHILQVEVHPRHQKRDLGLWVVHQALSLLRGMWTLAVLEPAPLGRRTAIFDSEDWKDDDNEGLDKRLEIAAAGHTLRKHFARMGFAQAGCTPELAHALFLTPSMYFLGDVESNAAMSNWKNKCDADTSGIYNPPLQHVPEGLDKELAEISTRYFEKSSQRIRALKNLIVKGASVHGSRALFVAAATVGIMGLDRLKELVELGGDVNAKDEDGNTPLHIAASFFCASAVECLLENGASRSMKNNHGETPKMAWECYTAQPCTADFMAGMDVEVPSDEIRARISSLLHDDSGAE